MHQPEHSYGSRVWNDADNDGEQDAGETGLNGVRVELYQDDGDGILNPALDTYIGFRTTSGDGDYLFPTLPAGNYLAAVFAPPTYEASPAHIVADTIDSDGTATTLNGHRAVVFPVTALTVGESDPTWDQGFHQTALAAVGNFAWFDTNGNGLQDEAADRGANGITVRLYDAASPTVPLATTTTANDAAGDPGYYLFDNLAPGSYFLEFVTPSGISIAPQGPVGTSDPTDSDASVATGRTDTFTLAASTYDPTWDAGLVLPTGTLAVGDRVWLDPNNNGTYQLGTGEPGINGVELSIYRDLNNNNILDAGDVYYGSTSTYALAGVDGYYQFTALPAASYIIVVNAENFLAGHALGGLATSTGNTVIDPDTGNVENDDNGTYAAGVGVLAQAVTLTVGGEPGPGGTSANGSVDFGFYNPSVKVALGNFVFSDDNRDGNYDPSAGELGAGGVIVELLRDANNDGDVLDSGEEISIATTSTGSIAGVDLGAYYFDNLAPGNYAVRLPAAQFAPGGLLFGSTSSPGASSGIGDDGADENGIDAPSPALTGITSNVFSVIPGSAPTGETGTMIAAYSGTLPDNSVDSTVDFGLFIPGSISGTVYQDNNNDNTGDVAVGGFSLTLYSDPNGDGNPADGAPVDNPNIPGIQNYTISTGDGSYAFTGLTLGNYVVVIGSVPSYSNINDLDSTTDGATSPADPANASITDLRIPVKLGSGETDSGNDFVVEQLGSISGNVLADTNNDDLGDSPLVGVQLVLVDASGNPVDGNPALPGVQNIIATTIAGGNYSFPNIPVGTYGVLEIQPIGYSSVSDIDGGNPDQIRPIIVLPDLDSPGNNFVEETTTGISGTVLVDTNNDNLGDTPLAGVTLTLYTDPNADGDPEDGVIVGTPVVSGPTGAYDFDNLGIGSYIVVQTQPTGYLTVTDGDTTTGGDDAPANVTTDNRLPVTLIAGEFDSGNDFVERPMPTVTIGNYVWNDTNGNGIQDGTETGLPGVTATLYDATGTTPITADIFGNPISPIVTTGSGAYLFTSLHPGQYTVKFTTVPMGYYPTATGAGTTATDSNGLSAQSAILSGGQSDLTLDSGFVQPVSIGNYIWNDTNGNGVQDGLETGAEGVVATLYNADNTAAVPTDVAGNSIAPITTNSTGAYLFENLRPGQYTVRFTAPSGYVATTVNAPGSTTANDSNGATAQSAVLTSGQSDLTLDTGYIITASISGTVYVDNNHDSSGDSVLNVVTLTLLDDTTGLPLDNPNLAGTQDYLITTTDGTYAFTGLAPGSYIVRETQPAGYITVTDLDSTPDTGGSPADPANTPTDNQLTVILMAGETDNGNDFIEELPSSLGNLVWFDANNNGIKDASEPGIDGVSVTLCDASGTPIDGDPNTTGVQPLTVLTGDDPATTLLVEKGWYFFPLLPAGSYTVKIATPPAAFPASSTQTDVADNQEDDDDNGAQATPGAVITSPIIVLGFNESDPAVDFGLFNPKPSNFADWATLVGLSGPDALPGGNPDGDLYDNLTEYALCTHPGTGVQPDAPFCVGLNPGTGKLVAFFKRLAGGLSDVTYTLEARDAYVGDGADGQGWFVGASMDSTAGFVTIVDNGDGSETVTHTDLEAIAGLGAGEGYVRLKLEGTGAIAGAESFSQVFGWYERTVGVQCETSSDPFVKKESFGGLIDSVNTGANTIDVNGSVGNGDLTTVIDSAKQYYVEVVAGDHEGHRFEIDEAATLAGDGKTLHVNTDVSLPTSEGNFNTATLADLGSLAGDTIVLREHRVMEDLFPTTGFTATISATTADRVLFFNNASSFNIYWMFNGSAPIGGVKRWVSSGDVTYTDEGPLRVVRPCESYYVHPKGSTQTLLHVGIVRTNALVCPLKAGWNFVGNGWPVDRHAAPDQAGVLPDLTVGVSDLGLTVPSGCTGSLSRTTSDQIQLWLADDPANAGAEGYQGYFLLNGDLSAFGLGVRSHWTSIGNTSLSDTNTTPGPRKGHGMFLKMQSPVGDWKIPAP